MPFIKTGGLADVVGSLPKYFDKKKYDVRVVLPKYSCMNQKWKDQLEYMDHFYMNLAGEDRYVGILKYVQDGITFYFIDNEYYFNGFAPYDGDPRWNIEKFAFFYIILHFPKIAKVSVWFICVCIPTGSYLRSMPRILSWSVSPFRY